MKRGYTVIDCTPTWIGLLPALLNLVENGKLDSILRGELQRMAMAADRWNTHVKKNRNP